MEGELRTCPYNARHIILKDELSKHMAVCVDRQTVIDGKVFISYEIAHSGAGEGVI